MKEILPNITIHPDFETYKRQEFEAGNPPRQETLRLISTIVLIARAEEIVRKRVEWRTFVDNMGA